MAFDFKKLMDPAVREELRIQREADEAKAEALEKKLRAWLDTAFDHYETLSEKERDFIRSCRARLNSFLLLTGPQEKWLSDIAAKLA